MSNGKIIVTGGSGFIGTNAMEYFIKKGYDVINIDYQKPKNKMHINYWRNINILDKDAFEQTVLEFMPDYIIHLAARCDLKGKNLVDYAANTKGIENLLSICKNSKLNLKKVLITSSMLVCEPGYSPNNQKDYKPHTIYGESKVITETLVWEQQPLCDWAILRPTSIWGPWFDEPYRNFFDVIIKRQYMHIGHKSARMTYGYVENTVQQISAILFADTKDSKNKIFYLGDYEPTNLEEWANEIARELNRSIPRVPYFIIKMGAVFGDILKNIGIDFPLTSFRLKNMITDNISDLVETKKILPDLPYSRIDGVKKTLNWMEHDICN